MKKRQKKLKKIVNIGINLRVFGVSKHIALKMVIKSTMSCIRPLSTLTSNNFRLVQQKNSKNDAKMQKFATFCSQKLLKMTF